MSSARLAYSSANIILALEDAPEEEQAPPASPLDQIGSMIAGAAGTLVQLALASVQLFFVRLQRKLKASMYEAPFYAKAMIQLAVEDSSVKWDAFSAEARRAVGDAPRYYLDASILLVWSAGEALASFIAGPDEFVDSVAASVKVELETAQERADARVGEAKGARDEMKR